jgi:hypothetical protein
MLPILDYVMAVLVTAIHVFAAQIAEAWMPS